MTSAELLRSVSTEELREAARHMESEQRNGSVYALAAAALSLIAEWRELDNSMVSCDDEGIAEVGVYAGREAEYERLIRRLADALSESEREREPYAGMLVCGDPGCGCCAHVRELREAFYKANGWSP